MRPAYSIPSKHNAGRGRNIMLKKCSRCGEWKEIGCFHKDSRAKDGVVSACKKCVLEKSKQYYANNREKIIDYQHMYRKKNKDKIRESRQQYWAENKERLHEEKKRYYQKNREHIRKKAKLWREYNPDKVKAYNDAYREAYRDDLRKKKQEYYQKNKINIQSRTHAYYSKNKRRVIDTCVKYKRNRSKTDPLFAFNRRIRHLVYMSLKNKNYSKDSNAMKIIGCTYDCAWEHLLQTWEKNYGRPWDGEPYHIDHIIPLATAETKEDVVSLCHYTNLQLLTPEDNLKKGATVS